ncbi:Septin-domain-containing protein [Auriculariales sp. MPI-PUGE-AT-0066]|nr:Septin-domain-containing protein [Auriculariales sp. MPI-PUGE-AT-0066]
MVLGFGRKSRKTAEEPPLKVSPSLPNIGQQGVAWGNLVDAAALRDQETSQAPPAAAKLSFQTLRGSIPFHKPFRAGAEPAPIPEGDGSIASLYARQPASASLPGTATPPSAFKRLAGGTTSMYGGKRRQKVAPTFNLMVAGGQGTGKTSFLRLLLDTCDLSPNATADQRTTVNNFIRTSTRPTVAVQTACIEICETKVDRVLLSVIDTPGLDFSVGAELGLERSVSGIVKYFDLQFAETLGEEAKVMRQNKGDQHVHLCIYLVEPDSVITVSQRKAKLALPRLNRSTASLRYANAKDRAESSGESSESSDDDNEEDNVPARHRLTMNPSEIRAIKRLATRVNVLPVVARADSLTDEKLNAIKRAVRRDLAEAGINFGVFDSLDPSLPTRKTHRQPRGLASTDPGSRPEARDEPEEEAPPAPVIQIKKSRFGTLTRSRSKRNLQEQDADLFGESRQPNVTDTRERVMSLAIAPGVNILTTQPILPFAVVAPEQPREKREKRKKKHANGNGVANGDASPGAEQPNHPERPREERRRSTGAISVASTTVTVPVSPTDEGDHTGTGLPYMMSPLHQAMRGRFVRRYRWGTIDVLDPAHCDFAALRTAVLNTHLKQLKATTRDVLYEQFRTEKLLARRATRNINDEDRKRLLEDLGI